MHHKVGCVVSRILFSFYSIKCCCSSSPNCSVIQYADYTVISGFLLNGKHRYVNKVQKFVGWCDHHYLVLNVKKIKEMFFFFNCHRLPGGLILLFFMIMEHVSEHKYLGTVIDDKLK